MSAEQRDSAAPGTDEPGARARSLLEALAVLGEGSFALIDAAAVAGIRLGDEIDELRSTGAVTVEGRFGLRARIVDPDLRHTVYQSIPSAQRRRLHARAAAGLTGHDALRHLTLAAASPDARLADELEDHARSLHAGGRHGEAAEVWEWASTLSPGPQERFRRRIECDIDRVFAGAIDAVEPDLANHAIASVEKALLTGLVAVWRGEWRQAVDALSSASKSRDDRLWALLAAAKMRSGYPVVEILAALHRIGSPMAGSPAFARFAIQSRALVAARDSRQEVGVVGAAHDIPTRDTYDLAVRGVVRVLDGAFEEAADDLSEVARRLRIPSRARGDGMLHAALGAALWFGGDLESAETAFERGRVSAWDHDNPLKLSLSSLGAIGAADLVRADRLLNRARSRLRAEPWHEGLLAYVITRALRLHASGQSAARREEAGRLRRDFGSSALAPGVSPRHLWLLYRGLLAAWEADAEGAMECADQLAHATGPNWAAPAALWLQMQLEEATSEADARLSARRVAALVPTGFPLLDIHLSLDSARVLGDAAMMRRAMEAYRNSSAVPHAMRRGAALDVELDLSEREREVVELVASGMSYAQIAKTLYLSPSTVKFHLSRVYAKTGVSGRHELVSLIRDPFPL